jgi:hypothetical protein
MGAVIWRGPPRPLALNLMTQGAALMNLTPNDRPI